MDPDGLDELQKQESYTRTFLTGSIRRQAYPFTDGLPVDSNLVTLLAWAEHLNVAPVRHNRFFQAKTAGRLARIETDKRRTLSFSLFWPGRILSAAATLLSVVAAVIVVFIDWHMLLRPFGWWSPLFSLAAAVGSFGIMFLFLVWASDSSPSSPWGRHYLNITENDEDIAHFVSKIEMNEIFIWGLIFGGPLAYAVAITPLAAWPALGYFAAAILGPLVLFYLPLLVLCARTTRFYLYRPNSYIDMYGDPSSRHWLQAGESRTIVVEPVEASLLDTR